MEVFRAEIKQQKKELGTSVRKKNTHKKKTERMTIGFPSPPEILRLCLMFIIITLCEVVLNRFRVNI